MAGSTPMRIPKASQDAIVQYQKQCYQMLNNQWDIRNQYRNIDLAYIREQDFTKVQQRAQAANIFGDPTKFQNITVPIVMPQVEAAVTYQSAVFLTPVPLFGWVAAPGDESAALMYQAVIEENSIRGGWIQQLMMFFRDAFKYNLGIVEVNWDRVVTAAIETDLTFTGGKEGKPKEVIWEGNCVTRWDPYNTFWDTRYKPTEVYKNGEFIGKTEIMSRIHLKKFINELPDKQVQNIIPAFESGLSGGGGGGMGGIESYYIPQINPQALISNQNWPYATTDWMAWAGMLPNIQGATQIQYQNLYEVTTLYARILPSDFNLIVPSANTPQVWKFIFVNHQVLIYAERQTNAHGFLPVLLGQSNEDGLGYQTKSLAQNATSFQQVGSALVNSTMAARRRAISDRGIYDPSRISEAHINSDNPSAKIPLRLAGYGKPINEAYYSIPFRDDQSPIAFSELAQVMQMANVVNGQNQAKQGQFVKGNKTDSQWNSTMDNANGRDQMTSLLFEAQIFTPMKEIIKINTLQYQAGISIFSPSQQKTVKIDPIVLRKSFSTYRVTDGLTPTDKVISSDDFQAALQAVMTPGSPIAGAYNTGPMFSYLMKTKNVDLTPFEKPPAQVAYEQAVESWKEVMMQLASKGVDPKGLPPQPTPQQFGYDPNVGSNAPAQSAPTSTNGTVAPTGPTTASAPTTVQ